LIPTIPDAPLSQYDELDAVHIVSHGSDGAVKLGNTWLNADNVEAYAGQFVNWRDALATDADLLFYGCDLAAGEDGQFLVESLGALTGADVAASTDDTGHAVLGGDWELEFTAGNIETDVAFGVDVQRAWSHLMAVETVRDEFNAVSYSSNNGTQNWTSNWVETSDDGSASTGNIRVESNKLHLDNQDGGDYENVTRAADLSGATTATLTFDFDGYAYSGTDSFAIEVSDDGGTGWTQLEEIAYVDDPGTNFNGNRSYDLESYVSLAANMVVRFEITSGFAGPSQHVNFDNVQIQYTTGNTAPTISLPGGPLSYTENDSATVIDSAATASDGDATDFDTGTLTVDFTANGTANDRLAIRNQGTGSEQVGISGSNVTYEGTTIGTFTGGTNGFTPLVITFNASSSATSVQAVMRNITYENVSEDPSTSARTVRFVLTDGDGGTSNTETETINVGAVNDSPVITSNGGGATASINIAENSTVVTTVTSSDVDGGTPSYSITGGADQAKFSINSSTGELTFQAAPNFENPTDADTDNVYEVTVQVSDGAGGTDSQAISVTVTDVDEFDVGAVTDSNATANAVDENAANGTLVNLTAYATDDDGTNNTITYSLDDDANGRFTIDGSTGVVTVADGTQLNRESDASHDITVRATSADGSSSTETFTITVNDVDEFDVGAVTDSNATANSVDENAANGTVVNITASASDADATTNTITYSLDDDANGRFTIDGSTGVVTVADGTQLNRESDASHDITVRATSADGSSSTETFTITVNDVDEFDVGGVTDSNGTDNSVAEDAGIGTAVGLTASASDADATTNTITYSLDDNAGGRFAINGTTGVVTVNAALDYETSTSHSVTVRATSADGSFSTQSFTIDVNDVNESGASAISDTDGDPDAVQENSAIGTTVGVTASANDPDGTDTVSYSLDDNAGGRFAINSSTGVVTVASGIDREAAGSYDITVRATSTDTSFTTKTFTITIGDVDEFDVTAPSDTDGTADAVDENAANGTTVGITASASDADATTNGVTYSLTDDAGGRFAINSSTGVVTVADGTLLNREAAASHGITVRATSADGSTNDTVFTVSLNDVDEFDVGAVTDSDGTDNSVAEDAGIGTAVGLTASASDADATTNTIAYALDDNAGGRFAINGTTGVVTVNAALDYETSTSHSVTVRATSTDGSFSTQSFTIDVTDVNESGVSAISDTDGDPDAVGENSAIGTTVGVTAYANDPDGTDTVSYSLDDNAGGRFAINSTTGVVTVASGIDREAASSYDITVRATSTDTSFTTKTFTITIGDVDEFDVTAPSDTDGTADAVDENAANGTTVGITASASDADATTNAVTYSLADDAGGRFAINSSTGVVTVADGTQLNREATASHDITVRATSADGSTNDRVFTVNLNDVDEFDVGAVTDSNGTANSVAEDAGIGTAVGLTASASDADATTNTITYTLDDNAGGRFAINGTTGVVTVNAALDYETSTSYSVTVRATSADGSFSTQSFTIDVTDVNESGVSAISDTDGDPDAVQENSAIGTTVGVTAYANDPDGTDTVSYSLDDNAGGRFAINSTTGVVTVASGIDREAAGSYDITVRATSTDTSFTTKTFTITIGPVNDNSPVFNSSNSANVAENTTAVLTVNATDADLPAQTVTYSITGGADQAKFSIDASTGELTFQAAPDYENPADADTDNVYEVQVTANDGNGATTSQAISVTVTDANDAPTITSSSTPTAAENQTTVLTVTATDLDIPANTITFSITGGVDAARFSVNATTGELSFNTAPNFENPSDVGTDNVYDLQVTADDGNGGTTAQNIAVTVTNVNETPVNTVPSSQTTAVDTPLTFSFGNGNQISISDVDAASNPVRVTLTAVNGTITLNGIAGLSFSTGDGTADATMTFDGTVAAINTALDGMVFTPTPGYGGSATLTLLTDDLGSTGSGSPLTDADAVSIQVGAMSYQNGVDGYAGTEDTELREANPSTSFGNDTGISIDLNNGGLESQGLIRFDNLFGNGAGQIPFGSTINSASLTVHVFDTSGSGTTITLHQMLTAWSEASTWNSMTNGLERNDVEVSSTTDSTMMLAEFTGPQTFYGLESTVQSWRDGATNNGWALFSDSTDGWDFRSSEYGVVAERPVLTIDFTPPIPAVLDLDTDNSTAGGADFAGTFVEDLGPVSIVDSGASLTDTDSPNLISMTVTITNLQDGAAELLAADTSGTGISASYDSATGVLSLTGTDSVANYEQVLRTLTYDNSSNTPDPTARIITITADDPYKTSNVATATISVASSNDNPVVTSSATASIAENTTAVMTVTATDVDGDTPTYSITGGADQTKFAINATTGELTFQAAPDYEIPTDAGANNVYEVQVTADDGNGGTASQSITVTVTPVNDNSPVFASSNTANVAENTMAVMTVSATDADSPAQTVTYSITGSADQAKFSINSTTGELTFQAAPDSEAPTDADTNNVYEVQVTADDGNGRTTALSISVTVTDTDEFDVGAVTDSNATANAVDENTANGTLVNITASASDADATTNTITYSLADDDGSRFAIDANTGVVTVAGAIDREADGPTRSITVRATSADGSYTDQAFAIDINDLDEFDAGAVTDSNATANAVDENATNGTLVNITASASDADATTNTITYSLADDDGGRFAIDTNTGVVTVARAIDRETDGPTRNITVRATSADGSTADTVLTISLNDIDEFDVGAVTDSDGTANSVAEDAGIGTAVGLTASASDADATTNTITYSLAADDGSRFAIDANTGVVTVAGAIDREADGPTRNITVRATSADGSFTDQVFSVDINDLDEFDVGAVTDTDGTTNAVDENAVIGTTVGVTANASDADATTNTITYSLTDNDGGRFAIDANTGVVTVAGAIDREADGPTRNITVRATSADGSYTDQAFAVNLIDENDNAPIITPGQTFSVRENSANGTNVGTAVATDADTVGSLTGWTLTGGNTDGIFAINSATGEITIADNTNLDYETTPSYTLTLTVSDGVNTSAPQTVTITIENVNEAPVNSTPGPQVTSEDTPLVFSSAGGNAITVSDVDAGSNPVVATLNATNGTLTLGSTVGLTFGTGDGVDDTTVVFVGTIDEINNALEGLRFDPVPDYNGPATIDITVDDRGNVGLDGTKTDLDTINITVTPVNDAPIANDDAFVLDEHSLAGTPVGTVSASDVDAGDVLSYRIMGGSGSSVFGIDPATGEVLVVDTDSLVYETNPSFDLSVEARDLAGATDMATVTVILRNTNDPPQAADDSYTVDSLHTLNVAGSGLLANDVDPDGDTVAVLLVSGPSHGTLTLGTDGTFQYTPDDGYVGDDSFAYQITDGLESSGSATVGVKVLAVESPPTDSPSDDNDAADEPDATEEDNTTSEMEGEATGSSDGPDAEAADSSPTENTSQTLDRGDSPGATPEQPTTTTVAVNPSAEDDSPFSSQLRRTAPEDRAIDSTHRPSLRQNDMSVDTSVDRATRIQREYGTLWNQLDTLQEELVKEDAADETFETFVVGTTAVSVTGLTVGYVMWLIRGGTLLASLLTSLPAWCSFDPLPVLNSFDEPKRRPDDDISFQSLVAAEN